MSNIYYVKIDDHNWVKNYAGSVQYPLGLTLEIIKVSVLGGILYCKLFNY